MATPLPAIILTIETAVPPAEAWTALTVPMELLVDYLEDLAAVLGNAA